MVRESREGCMCGWWEGGWLLELRRGRDVDAEVGCKCYWEQEEGGEW